MKALYVSLFAVCLALAGCGEKKERERGTVRIRGGDNIATPGSTPGTGNVVPGAAFQRLYGNVTGYTTNNVKSLVSVTMDPETDMELPIGGIAMSGEMKLSTTSQDIRALGSGSAQIANGSEFAIFILDNRTIAHGEQAITIGFRPGSNGYSVSGSVSGGNVNITFRDQYGDIIVSGTYNANSFTGDVSGTISFKNNGGLNPGQTLVLGNFRVPTCGFFHCQ